MNRKSLNWLVLCVPLVAEAQPQTLEECVEENLKVAEPTMTVGELRSECKVDMLPMPEPEKIPAAMKRLAMEKRTEWNPFVITPHKQNYILPYTYMEEPNNQPYDPGGVEFLENREAKLQFSFKVPLTEDDLLVLGDSLYFGFTLQAYWQLYNHEISAPFRETNYNPEIFYTAPIGISDEGHGAAIRLGVEHQSNGRSQLLSRSWNRIYTELFYAKDNYLISFKPWYRIPEDAKQDPYSAKGDDNPDIDDYMGYFELRGSMEFRKYEASIMVRNNLRSENYGAFELGLSFPLWGRLRGYAQYFNGYGESLIDYNYRMERLGIGVLLTDLM